MLGVNYKRSNPNLWLGQPATAQNVVPGASGLAPGNVKEIRLYLAEIQNRAASAQGCALVGLLPDTMWEAGQWVDATTIYTADTDDAQSAVTNDFPLETLTNSDGHIIGANVPF